MRRQGYVADFVQKEGAAVGVFKPALALAFRAGEGTADMAEELAFEDVFAQGGAVERHERLVLARAVDVESFGYKFFASTAFAQNQGRGRGGGQLAHFGDDGVHRFGVADDAFEAELFVELAL